MVMGKRVGSFLYIFCIQLVEYLLQAGADASCKTTDDRSALFYAQKRANKIITDLLVAAMYHSSLPSSAFFLLFFFQ